MPSLLEFYHDVTESILLLRNHGPPLVEKNSPSFMADMYYVKKGDKVTI